MRSNDDSTRLYMKCQYLSPGLGMTPVGSPAPVLDLHRSSETGELVCSLVGVDGVVETDCSNREI